MTRKGSHGSDCGEVLDFCGDLSTSLSPFTFFLFLFFAGLIFLAHSFFFFFRGYFLLVLSYWHILMVVHGSGVAA